MFCLLFFFGAWEALKKLGDSPSCLPRKKPFPPKFPQNRRSDGGHFVVDQFSVPLHSNFSFQFCQGHILVIITRKVRSSQVIHLVVLLVAPSWSRSMSTDPMTKDCRESPSSQSAVTRYLERKFIVFTPDFESSTRTVSSQKSQTRDLDSSSCLSTSYITSLWLHFYLFLHSQQTLLDLPGLDLICPHNRRVLSFNLGSVLSLT